MAFQDDKYLYLPITGDNIIEKLLLLFHPRMHISFFQIATGPVIFLCATTAITVINTNVLKLLKDL